MSNAKAEETIALLWSLLAAILWLGGVSPVLVVPVVLVAVVNHVTAIVLACVERKASRDRIRRDGGKEDYVTWDER